ncbi:MAG: energy transducer TonB, partial [Rubrivivax sp.]
PEQAPPEPQQLKMDGPAGDGPSAFASGQVSQEYKGGDIGTGGGGNRLQFAFFTNRLTRHIQAELARNRDLKGQDYRISVRVWLGDGGQLQRVELASSSGNDATDDLLRQALTRVSSLDQIPSNLPQPLSLRITNRVTG